jgi:hypothetical protein
MIKETGSDKPILSTCGTPYFTDKMHEVDLTPTRAVFNRFTPQGILHHKPQYMDDYRKIKAPEPARFVSGHFLFTTGDFIENVPSDPGLYFNGEEISLAVRAYTHGYDLFHPNKLILYHLYHRPHINQHVVDHDPWNSECTEPWWSNLEVQNVKRVRALLGIPPSPTEPKEFNKEVPDLGKFGLGTKRELIDYEKYAGINFKLQAVQSHTRHGSPPPNPMIIGGELDWSKAFKSSYTAILEFDPEEIDKPDDCSYWYVGAHDINKNEVHRQKIDGSTAIKLLTQSPIRLAINITSFTEPHTWTICPYSASKGWVSRTTKQIKLQ